MISGYLYVFLINAQKLKSYFGCIIARFFVLCFFYVQFIVPFVLYISILNFKKKFMQYELNYGMTLKRFFPQNFFELNDVDSLVYV